MRVPIKWRRLNFFFGGGGGNRSYNFKPNNNFPTHYSSALRKHENFSYGGDCNSSLL